MKTLEKSVLTLAVVLCTFLLTGNTVYQWTDENGVVHFSQTAPDNDQQAVETTLRNAPRTGGTIAPAPEATSVPSESQDSNEPESVSEKVVPSYTKSPENCERARGMLATLNEGANRQVRLRDPETGEYSVATDEDRNTQRQRALAQIDRDC